MWSAIFISVLFLLIIGCIVVLCNIKPESAASERSRRKIITGKTGEIPAQRSIPGTTLPGVRTDTVMMPAIKPGRHA